MVHPTDTLRPTGTARRPRDPRNPHPSWRSAPIGNGPDQDRADRGQIANADDFWRRLGL
jgi:hypothetical protein